ncbi:PREDICTED: twitchin-like, partial [Priapulus caudatus]|uniref:Twitchin-like n=1 Tax=Priapulus caudatus TaxID=37621 RepID=A0ABM1F7N2_PRICU
KDKCKLRWKKPTDDGGSGIQEYLVEKLDTTKGVWTEVARVDGDTPYCDVDKLTPGHEYLFRVKAVNRQGESEPLVITDPIIAKDPWDPPGQPGTPNITDWDKDHMDIAWDPPIKTGGAPIEKYIIEKKDKSLPFWEKAAEVPGDEHKGTVPNLLPGAEYEFRVVAVNKAGPGEPSDPSRSQVAKPRFG